MSEGLAPRRAAPKPAGSSPRFSTARRAAPVKIWQAQAGELSKQLLGDNTFPRGATTFATRRGISASVGPVLRIRPLVGVNDSIGVKGAKVTARGRRKRGYPPIIQGQVKGE